MHRFKKSRSAHLAAAAAVALAVGVPASFGGVGFAAKLVGFAETTPVAAQYPPSKVTICHHTHSLTNPFVTITVSERALPAHLRHGDTTGLCPQSLAATAKPLKVHTAHESKSKQKGNKGRHLGPKSSTHLPAAANHGQGKGQGAGKPTTTGPENGHGMALGKSKVHGQGNGQGHGQGQGQGHGQSDAHRNNSGGGKGNGHKP